MSSQNDGTIRVDDYQKDTQERFVASLALKNKMSNEQVEALEAEKNASLAEQFPEQEVRYKTIDKFAGTIDGKGYSREVFVKTEVKYLWDKRKNQLVGVEEFGTMLPYLPAVAEASATTISTPNEEKGATGRVSRTCVFTIPEKTKIPAEYDISSVKETAGGYLLSTVAKTFSAAITGADLLQK